MILFRNDGTKQKCTELDDEFESSVNLKEALWVFPNNMWPTNVVAKLLKKKSKQLQSENR